MPSRSESSFGDSAASLPHMKSICLLHLGGSQSIYHDPPKKDTDAAAGRNTTHSPFQLSFRDSAFRRSPHSLFAFALFEKLAHFLSYLCRHSVHFLLQTLASRYGVVPYNKADQFARMSHLSLARRTYQEDLSKQRQILRFLRRIHPLDRGRCCAGIFSLNVEGVVTEPRRTCSLWMPHSSFTRGQSVD